jgi:hypothetical protein
LRGADIIRKKRRTDQEAVDARTTEMFGFVDYRCESMTQPESIAIGSGPVVSEDTPAVAEYMAACGI